MTNMRRRETNTVRGVVDFVRNAQTGSQEKKLFFNITKHDKTKQEGKKRVMLEIIFSESS